MRTSSKAELAFKKQLVRNTKKLVADPSVGLRDKLALIQQAVTENSAKLSTLRKARLVTTDPAKVDHLDRLITLRQRATRYLVAASKLLVRRDDALRPAQVNAPLSSVAASSPPGPPLS